MTGPRLDQPSAASGGLFNISDRNRRRGAHPFTGHAVFRRCLQGLHPHCLIEPDMWRDIFLKNKGPLLDVFHKLIIDMQSMADAIEKDDGQKLEDLLTDSRLTRRRVIEKEHISLLPEDKSAKLEDTLFRPYSSDD